MKQVIFDYDYAQILYDPTVKLGILVWKRNPITVNIKMHLK
jgi:hypothetical protein